MSEIKIRSAVPDDAEKLLSIYAPYVTETAITFEYDVPSVEEFRARIEKTLAVYPYIVAVCDGTIVGYAYASRFSERKAYDFSVELSVYIDKNYYGKCSPSRADIESTKVLQQAAGILGITFMDHIIITKNDYFSFLEHDML